MPTTILLIYLRVEKIEVDLLIIFVVCQLGCLKLYHKIKDLRMTITIFVDTFYNAKFSCDYGGDNYTLCLSLKLQVIPLKGMLNLYHFTRG